MHYHDCKPLITSIHILYGPHIDQEKVIYLTCSSGCFILSELKLSGQDGKNKSWGINACTQMYTYTCACTDRYNAHAHPHTVLSMLDPHL